MAPSYAQGLPPTLASSFDAVVLLDGEEFPVHSQIASLHSPMLAELLAGEPERGATGGQPPAYRLNPPGGTAGLGEEEEEQSTPRTAARSYDPRRRPVLSPETFAAFLGFCYGQQPDMGNRLAPLGRLLDAAEVLGCTSLAPAVDRALSAALLGEGHPDLAGAASLATRHRLVHSMAAILPLLSYRPGGRARRGSGGGGARDWEAAFDRLDDETKRMAFALARSTPEEREEQGVAELGAAASYCARALAGGGWARRERSPGRREAPASPGSPDFW